MTSRKAHAVLGLCAVALAAGSSHAACDLRGTVTDVRGDPSSARLARNRQVALVRPGLRLCAGDILSAGRSTTIFYNTVDDQPARVSGASFRFSEREGQADEAMDADSAADNPPH